MASSTKDWLVDCVPIIQQDLPKEDTVIQIAYAFETLESFATQIFDQIQVELDKRKARLSQIRQRCAVAQAKVDKVTGISRSIKVVSSNKYPTRNEELVNYTINPVRTPYKSTTKVHHSNSNDPKVSIAEKLKFYHVKDYNDGKTSLSGNCSKGLGTFPKHLKSVNNLVLFNRHENVFKEYKIVDPLQTSPKQHIFEDIYKEKLLVEPAPLSVHSHLDWLNYRHDRHFFYSPAVTNVTDLQAPQDLPDLPGIASDLQYSIDNQYSDAVDFANAEENVEIVPVLPKLDTEQSSGPSKDIQTPPPPAPPPPPPPPPPQPPRSIEEASSEVTDRSSSQPQLPPSANSDQRANLMEAIRKAGGSSVLKRATPREPLKAQDPPAGMSLMGELHNKLSMRRKGISGKFDVDPGSGMMDKIGSMIPPPPSKPPIESDSDEEWDD